MRRDHITVPVHDARRKRAQLGKAKLGRDLPAHEDDAFGFERGDAAQKHPGVDRLFRFAVPIGVTVQRPERMAPLGERHIPEQPAQEVAVRGVGVAAQIDLAAFERARKKNYGRMVMNYNDVSETANLLMSLCFSGHEPFDELEACRSVTLEDAERRLALLREECAALSVISPIIKED